MAKKSEFLKENESFEDLEFEGLHIIQSADGYRFTSDSVVLAGLAEARAGAKAIDLGTGCGVIALLFAARTGAEVWGVEIQDRLADMAARSVEYNGYLQRVHIVHADMREAHKILDAGTFDVAIANPPYLPLQKTDGAHGMKKNAKNKIATQTNPPCGMKQDAENLPCSEQFGEGKSPYAGQSDTDNLSFGQGVSERDACKTEVFVTLSEVFSSARALLKYGGKLFLISKAERLTDILSGLRAEGLEPKRLVPVYPREGSDADTVVVTAVKGGKPPLAFAAPLTVKDKDGNLSEEMRRIYHK